jgi:DNA-binding CsgD family transcriptional regulator
VASAAWHGADSADELATLVCSSLRRLIPCDAAGWNEIDLDGEVVRVHNEPELEFELEQLNRWVATHPVLRHVLETGDLRARTISDLLDPEAFHRTRLYRQVYRVLGVEDQLGAAVEVDGSRIVAVALNRGDRSFTYDDRAMLDLLRPHLVAAHDRATRRAEAEERIAALANGLARGGRSVVFLGEDGELADVPDAARAMMERWFGSPPARLDQTNYERDDGTLRVRAVEWGRTRLLLLDEQRFVADARRARELGLTAREIQVIGLAGRGLTNRAIGERLGISGRTVHKHLQNVYGKLGVGTRAAAVESLAGDGTSG